jgi:hypothetical protein
MNDEPHKYAIPIEEEVLPMSDSSTQPSAAAALLVIE